MKDLIQLLLLLFLFLLLGISVIFAVSYFELFDPKAGLFDPKVGVILGTRAY